jgi:hypothetical protein
MVNNKEKAMSNSSTLSPIKISLVAPQRVGKTTLTALVLGDTTKALPAPFKVSPATDADQDRIAKHNRALHAAIISEDFIFNPEPGIKGTGQEIVMYNFKIEFKELVQPFSLMDIPGGWFRGSQNRPPDLWERYKEQLHTSIALWVPVDSVILAEALEPAEKKKSRQLLMTTDVRDIVQEWAKYRKLNDQEPAILCFVPMKCETYFSQAMNRRIPEDFFTTFSNEYQLVLDAAKDACPHCMVYYTPVESIGCISVKYIDWNLENDEALDDDDQELPVSVIYRTIPPYYQKIAGIEALTAPIYRYGADRINHFLEERIKGTISERNRKQKELDERDLITWFLDLFGGKAEKLERIGDLTKLADALEKDLTELGAALRGLADRSVNALHAKEL